MGNHDLLSFDEPSVPAFEAAGSAQDLSMQGMDLFGPPPMGPATEPASAVVASQASDLSSQGVDLFSLPSAGPAAEPEVPLDSAGSPSEASQEATSSRRNDDIMRLFKQCEKPAPPANNLSRPADGRFAAFDDMELYAAGPPAVGGFLNAPALTNTSAYVSSIAPPSDVTAAPIQAKPQDNQAAHVMSLFTQDPPVTAAPHIETCVWDGCTTAPQQGTVHLTADQLLQCKPQELAQMQHMISQVMKAQNQASAPSAPISPAMHCAPVVQSTNPNNVPQEEAPVEKKREFDDLVLLFKEKGVST